MNVDSVMSWLNPRRLAPLSLLVLGAAGGCKREEPTFVKVTTPPAPAAAPMVAAPGAGQGGQLPPGHPPMGAAPGAAMPPPGMAGAVPPPPAVAEGAGLTWKLPAGWTESRTGGMRYATLRPADGKVEVSVVVLGGPAGGELANVNRWRGQLGLAPLDEAARAAARVAVKSAVGEVSLYDFTSEGQPASRMVVGLLSHKGSTWFLKLTGESASVESARAGFNQVLESLGST